MGFTFLTPIDALFALAAAIRSPPSGWPSPGWTRCAASSR